MIKIGINNFWSLDGATTEQRRTPEQIIPSLVHDIQGMVIKAKENDIIPVICSILPTNLPQSGNNTIRNTSILRVNEHLQKIADERGAIYVDFHSRMITEGGSELRDELADDGLHPHLLGYDIMADALREELERKGIQI